MIRALPPSIAFRLRGVKSNRDAIGAIITIQSHVGKQTKSLQAGSGFLSQHSKELLFGLGQTRGPSRFQFGGRVGSCRNFGIYPSTIGSGWKKATTNSARNRSSCRTEIHLRPSRNHLNHYRSMSKPGFWRPSLPRRFLCPTTRAKWYSNLITRKTYASELLGARLVAL